MIESIKTACAVAGGFAVFILAFLFQCVLAAIPVLIGIAILKWLFW